MATRMATLLYGGKPSADVEAGNRADTADTLDMPAVPAPMFPYAPSFVPPTAHMTPASAASSPVSAASTPASAPPASASEPPPAGPDMPPMRPMYPTPSPWVQPAKANANAMRGLVLGLVAASVLFAGLSIFGIALAWSYALTTVAKLALMVLGGYLIAAGVAYIVSLEPERNAASPA